jgi:hypothetical protein
MTETNQNLKLCRGDSATVFVDLKRADGTPYDPTIPAAIKYRVARSLSSDAPALIAKEMGDGITNAPGGINIELTSADTDIRPGIYPQLLRVFDGEDIDTMLIGVLVIKPSLKMGPWRLPKSAGLALSSKAPSVVRA